MKNKNGESLVSRIFTLRNMAVVFLVVYFAIFLAYPIFKPSRAVCITGIL